MTQGRIKTSFTANPDILAAYQNLCSLKKTNVSAEVEKMMITQLSEAKNQKKITKHTKNVHTLLEEKR